MGILRATDLTKSFGIETVFSGISFELRRGDKLGLIGANGAGKSTLMRCMLGLEAVDSGRVGIPEGETIGYVEQDASLGQGTLYDELSAAWQDVMQWQRDMARLEKEIAQEKDHERQQVLIKQYGRITEKFERGGGYEYENIIRRVASGLGFTGGDLDRPISAFSGGQKTRISLAKALARRPDFLFLDEPTNHLDISMVEWLEEYLKDYSGGVLIISHDRYFLDQVATGILELEQHRIDEYRGNYTRYLVQKAERVASHTAAYEKQQEYIAKTEAYIDRFRAGIKSKQARGRQSQLSRLERLAAPVQADTLTFSFAALSECADRVAELEKVTAGYGDTTVFANLSLLIRKAEGVALIGPNGAGKTTLLKLLTGDLAPKAGKVKLGSRVKVGYFAQEHENLNSANRMLDEIMADFGLGEERARTLLGSFLFSGDDVYKVIGALSGGEKARLALLKLMMTGANFLILDEPTNHLDIPAKEAVEEAILAFPGTFLTVSHDRYFLDKVADRVIELSEGNLADYVGNYSYYRDKKAANPVKAPAKAEKPAAKAAENMSAGTAKPRKVDNTRLIEKLELEITELEIMVKVAERQLNDPASHADLEASRSLAEEYAATKEKLGSKYDKWLELTSEE
ncbi:ABC-F family ATP-binding cassette domain-containing protein [Anaerospora sp.]|uniref:ABC-F family ATP-binding cassette domain-containing protein n=1 Tax=Anaerospora sp. TaxID=1960278 RepID=UPI002899D488|nr:ABC-F family ATP-binding cassette domain-containing protein [Anaerospora sp.]